MGLESLLPISQRPPANMPISLNRLCRSKERILLTFVCVGLVIGCFGTVFFLPDLPSIKSVYKVYEKVQKAGPEFILQLPPLAKDDHSDVKYQQHHGQIDKPDFHLIEDQARLKAKIELEEKLENVNNQQKVLPRPSLIPLKTQKPSEK